jgi:hypothetical protein
MNIFYLHFDPKTCAQYHCDKHVVKMIIEYAQLLSTAHRILDGTEYIEQKYVQGSFPARWRKMKRWKLDDHREPILYKASHINHPSGVWVRQSLDHYQWLWNLASELCQEYRHRYGGEKDKQHKTSLVIQKLSFAPDNIARNGLFTEPPQAMPVDAKIPGDSISAYRNYYKMYKTRFATWKNREIPEWYK